MMPEQKKTIVITGSNSGIGFDAATRIAKRGHKVILACRTSEKSQAAVNEIHQILLREEKNECDGGVPSASQESPLQHANTTTTAELVAAECDLSNMQSIRNFAKSLESKNILDDGKIDVLCLNAGIARNSKEENIMRTPDGFELTVGVNHFGHFYLNSLLLPMVRTNTGRIVLTASSVHDPESPGGGNRKNHASLGDLAGLYKQGRDFAMIDGNSRFDAYKAYADSKLCNVLMTRHLQKRLDEQNTGVKAYCFSPGLILGSGFFRKENPYLIKFFDFVATHVFRIGENTHWGGGALEYMALSDTVASQPGGSYFSAPPGSSKYGEDAFGKQFTVQEVSKEALDDKKAARLWELSEKILGIVE